jgi:hypothetical protein
LLRFFMFKFYFISSCSSEKYKFQTKFFDLFFSTHNSSWSSSIIFSINITSWSRSFFNVS